MLADKFFENRTRLFLVMLLPAFIIYFKSFRFDFTTMDEQWLIVQNADLLKGWKALKDAFTKSITGLYYRPLLLTSVFLDYKIGRLSPTIYHISNLAFHLLSVYLLFKFLSFNKVSARLSFILAMLFSVHPALLHAVAWVPGRNDSLLGIFILASINNLLRYFDTFNIKYIVFNFLFFVAALFTKETALILPLVYVGFYLVHRKRYLKEFVFLIAGWILLATSFFILRNLIVEVPPPDNLSFFVILKNFLSAMLLYMGKGLLPFQQSVLPLLKNSSLVPGLISVGMLILSMINPGLKNKKIASIGLGMFVVILALPVWFSASKNGGEHYEHRIYAAMPGLLLFLSQLKVNSNSKFFLIVIAIIFIVFVFRTFMRMDVYKNKESFVTAGVKESPGYYLFLFQKSEYLYARGSFDSALVNLDQAIAMRPDKAQMYSNRGSIYYNKTIYEKAIIDFSKAIALSNAIDYRYYINRCFSYLMLNQVERALKDFIVLKQCCAQAIPPELAKEVNTRLSLFTEDLGKQILAQPANDQLYFKRGKLFLDMGYNEEGLQDLSKACELAPDNNEYLKLYMEQYEKK